MKTLAFALIFLLGSSVIAQDSYVRGHNRATHAPFRTAPDGFFYSNYNRMPSINPYTGFMGTRITPTPTYQPRPSYFTPGYQAPQRGAIHVRYGRW